MGRFVPVLPEIDGAAVVPLVTVKLMAVAREAEELDSPDIVGNAMLVLYETAEVPKV